MRTEWWRRLQPVEVSNELLAVGLEGRGSRIGERIEALLRNTRFIPTPSARPVASTALILMTLAGAAALTPRWIAFAQPPLSFEAASVKTNPACEEDRQTERFSPGHLTVACIKLSNLIQAAYSRFADGRTGNGPHLEIVGAPSWMASARYDIDATAQGGVRMEEMFGPMLRSLLEERFHLQIHHESRELPVYVLTAPKGNIRLQQSNESDCIPVDLKHSNDPSTRFCGITAQANGLHVTDDAHGMTMTEIAERMLGNRLDRPVINRTGLAGRFNAHLEFDRDSVETSGISIFTAVQEQLGLKLEPSKGPVPILVVDHVEKPHAN
jgi:uncharacterized protein (TIGR03435 family)